MLGLRLAVFIDLIIGGGGLFVKLCSIATRSHILTADWLTVRRFVQSQSSSGCARPVAGMAEARGRIPRMRR